MFHVGVDPEPGAEICDPTPEQKTAMDDVYAKIAAGEFADQFVAIKGGLRRLTRTVTPAVGRGHRPPSFHSAWTTRNRFHDRTIEGGAARPARRPAGITKRYGTSWPATGVDLALRPRRDPRGARRERGRQVDADEDPDRAGAARRGEVHLVRPPRHDPRSAGRRRSSGSAWCTSTSAWSISSPCGRTSSSVSAAGSTDGGPGTRSGRSVSTTASTSTPTPGSAALRRAAPAGRDGQVPTS